MKYLNKTVLGVFLLCCFLSVKGQKGTVIDEVIAVVGNEIATKSELDTKTNGVAVSGVKVDAQTKCDIFEDLLFSKLLLNQARVDSIEVSDGQVEAEMDRRLRYFIGQIGSEQALEEYYKKPISKIKEEMRMAMREQMLIQNMQGELSSGASVTPEEVSDYYQKIPVDSLPLINSEVEVAQIIAYAPDSKKEIDLVKEKLDEFRKRVGEGEKFSTLAVLYSEDKESAKRGGEIGFVGKAEVEPEYSAAAFKLKEGQVSPIVKTRYGYHIIQLIERRATKVNTRHILMKPKTDFESMEIAKNKLDSIYNLIQNDSLTFEQAAKKFSDDEDTKNGGGVMVNPQNASSLFEMDQIDPSLFFAIDKLEVEEITQAVQLNDPRLKKGYRLVKLNKRTEPHKANLSKDYQKIKTAALAEKQQKILQVWMEKAIKETYLKIDEEYLEGCEELAKRFNKQNQ